MIHKRLVTGALIASGIGLLAACGGSGSDGSGTPSTSTSSARGAITGFGSVIVNGTKYEVSGDTQVSVDDRDAVEDDLEVGMIVTVRGGADGTASEIAFDAEVEGPISAIDPAAGTLTVLGQTIKVTEKTSFGSDDTARTVGSLADLTSGNVVEASAFQGSNGTLRASRIQWEKAELGVDDEVEVKGHIANLKSDSMTFSINNQTVDYSRAQLEDIPGGTLTDGLFVEAEGSLENGIFMAREVESEDEGIEGEEGDEVELEGVITRVDSDTEFVLNGQQVRINDGTSFEDGVATDVAADIEVDVKGRLDASGVLEAAEVEFDREADTRLEDAVASIGTDSVTTVLGVTATITDKTRMEDDSEAEVRRFSLNDLNTSDRVEVRGFRDDAGDFIATRFERVEADETGCSLRARVEALNETELTLLGVTVLTNQQTEFEIDNGRDETLTQAEFFTEAGVNDLIEVESEVSGDCSEGQLAAEEVEIERD